MFDRKMMYTDDLTIIAESKQGLQDAQDEWKKMVQKHGMRMSLEKTWVGQQREELNKGMASCTLVEWLQKMGVRRQRIQAGANAHISRESQHTEIQDFTRLPSRQNTQMASGQRKPLVY